jgi:hypothetical protein
MARQWTAEQKAKQAALIRNWQPWQHSTGAKTEQGKANSAMNACKGYKRVKHRKIAKQIRTAKTMLDIVEKIERSNYAENPVLLNALRALSQQLKS